MDSNLSTIIKKEKENIFEDEYSKPSWDVEIKIETGHDIDDWSPQKFFSDQEAKVFPKLEKDDSQTCVVCYKYFPESHSLYKHNLIHLKVPLIRCKLLNCDECQKLYTNKISLVNHLITEHQPKKRYKGVKRILTCPFCNKIYPKESWYVHMRTVHAVGQWKCKVCDAVFNCERYLQRHIKFTHNVSGQKWECPKCLSKFKHKKNLTIHLKNVHNKHEYQCKTCKCPFQNKRNLEVHVKNVHNKIKLHSCYICGEIFQLLNHVKMHMIKVHGSKEFKIKKFY